MNKRIQELAEKAMESKGFLTAGDIVPPLPVKEFNKERFAELIVLEMCNVLDKAQWDKGEDWVCADGTRIIHEVKAHFGVK